MALVVMDHGAAAPRLERQSRLCAIERLDLAFLIDRQHDSLRRRVHVKADDVGQLSGEIRVAGAFKRANTMRLEFMGLPDALDRSQRKPRSLGHGDLSDALSRQAAWRRSSPRPARLSRRRWAVCRHARLVSEQPAHAFFGKPRLPAPHHRAAYPNQSRHTLHSKTFSRRENHPRSLHMLLLLVAIGNDRLQPCLVRSG
jgi:hypothetical protein